MNFFGMYAYKFALDAHGDQKRKYTNEPYINHPVNVAKILFQFGITDEKVIQAALLHDTVEDTHVTNFEIETIFGQRVAHLVYQVTDISTLEDGNRQTRKELDKKHLAESDKDGANIKLADLIDNSFSIVVHDKKFAQTYLKEKESLLQVLTHGQTELWLAANYILEVSKAQVF